MLYTYSNSVDRIPSNVLNVKYARLRKVQLVNVYRGKKHKLYGFELISRRNSFHFFAASKMQQVKWIRALRATCILFDIRNDYKIGAQIGKGSFGSVHLGQRKKTGKPNVAIKIFDKSAIESDRRLLEGTLREIDILRELRSPQIVKLFEVYESSRHVYLVMQLLQGGSLYD